MDWAWVAGASEGLGLAFAELLAARGHALVLIARRAEKLEAAAVRIRTRHDVRVVVHAVDVAEARARVSPADTGSFSSSFEESTKP